MIFLVPRLPGGGGGGGLDDPEDFDEISIGARSHSSADAAGECEQMPIPTELAEPDQSDEQADVPMVLDHPEAFDFAEIEEGVAAVDDDAHTDHPVALQGLDEVQMAAFKERGLVPLPRAASWLATASLPDPTEPCCRVWACLACDFG